MIFYDRSEKELNDKALEYLGKTGITNVTPGSRARLLLRVFNRLLRSYYATLDFNVTMAFVSRATGVFLDEIGFLLNCERLPGESDDNYRYRISHQVENAATANETAIRLAALSVDGVVNVYPRAFSFGTGSFSIYFTTETVPAPNEEDVVLKQVQAAIDNVRAYGIKGVALRPKNLLVSFDIEIGFSSELEGREAVKNSVKDDIERAIRNRVANLEMGEELIITDIIHEIRSTGGDNIKDCNITSMKINGKPVVIYNYRPYWDEKFYVDEIKFF